MTLAFAYQIMIGLFAATSFYSLDITINLSVCIYPTVDIKVYILL